LFDSLRRCEPDQVQRDSLSPHAEERAGTPVEAESIDGYGAVKDAPLARREAGESGMCEQKL
jgi:hypothetical protein